jgi:CRP/FNR family cyclic AMP-dependent transcriptional regulator
VQWALLTPLSDADRQRVLAATKPRRYERNEVVFHEEDPGDCLHLVKKGHLGVRVGLPSGESLTINLLSPGDAFGELALLGRPHRRTATVVAWEPAETLSLSGEAFAALCREDPTIERLVVSLLAERVDQLSQRLLEALYVGVDRRVYRRLAELCATYGGEPGTVIPLAQDDIAGLAGASRPTVNQVLQRLAADGVIRLSRRRMEVLEPGELQRRAKV